MFAKRVVLAALLLCGLSTAALADSKESALSTVTPGNTDLATGFQGGVNVNYTALSIANLMINASNLTTGTLPAARLPTPTGSTLGGIQSFTLVTHQWISAISTSGVPSATQPGFGDLSGSLAASQFGSSFTNGQLYIGSTTDGLMHLTTLTAGTNITITNSPGAITIAASGGGSGCSTSGSVGDALVDNGSGGCTSRAWTLPATVTSGGLMFASSSGVVASSGALTANAVLLGGGAGTAPSALGSLGTTTTVLHGNASGAPSFGAVVLTTDVSGILPVPNGGNGLATIAAHGVMLGEGTSNVAAPIATANAQCFMSAPSSYATTDPSFQTCPGITALTGDVTATGPGSAAATIATAAVTYAKFQTIVASSLFGNPTSGTLAGQAIGIGTNLAFNSTTLNVTFPVEATQGPSASITLASTDMGKVVVTTGASNTVTISATGCGTTVLAPSQSVLIQNADTGSNATTLTNSCSGTAPMIPAITSLPAGTSITLQMNQAGTAILAALNPASFSGSGSVTSVAFTSPGGIFGISGSPITTSGTLAESVTGTSGGIPYFSTASNLATSALLTQYGIIYGGGVGAAPVATAALGNGNFLQGGSTVPAASSYTLPTGTITSGAIPYASSATAVSMSALLTHYGLVYGGGAGGAPVSMAACGSGVPVLGGSTAPVCGTDANIAYTDVASSWTAGQAGAQSTPAISTATFTPNLNTSNHFIIGLTSACPCTLANPSNISSRVGETGVITFVQDGTGSRTIGTLGTNYVVEGGGSLTLASAANAQTDVSYYVYDSTHVKIGPVIGTATQVAGHYSYTGSAPAVSACGTSPSIDSHATDASGTVTVGSTATSCTITFNVAYVTYNHCRVTSGSTLTAFAYSYTKTAITVAATALGGDLVDYECDGS